MSAIIALFSAIVAAIGMGINLYQNQENIQAQQNTNQQNADLQQSINEQNIQHQQETLEEQQKFSREAAAQSDAYTRGLFNDLYSPQARVKQLKQAGLSVGLMYGTGGTGGSSSTSGAQAATPSIQPAIAQAPRMNAPLINPGLTNITDLINSLGNITSNKKTEKEIEHLDVQIKNIEAETNSTILSTQGTQLDNELKELEIKLKEGNLENNFRILDEQINQIKTMIEKSQEEIEGLKIDNANKQEMYDLAKKQAGQAIAESISKVALNNADRILTQSKTITEEKVREEIEAKCNLLKEQTNELLIKIEKGKIDLEYYELLKVAETEIKELEAKIQKWEWSQKEYLMILTASEKLINKLF